MATLLTKNYQVISRIYLTYGQVITYAKYSLQSREDNTTTYQLKSTYYIPSQATVSWGSATAKLDGTQKNYEYTTFYNGETTIQEVSRTIAHNEDGSSKTKNVATSWTASFGGSGSTSADITFPAIQRYATATSGTNFTDEEDPTLTFSNVGLYGLRAKITVGNTEIYSEDLADQTVTSYTYTLTANQRTQLRQLCTEPSMSVALSICSVENSTVVYTSTANVIMTIVNGTPTYTHAEEETNAKVITLLGSSSANSVVKNASLLQITITPTAYKEAIISSVKITHPDQTETKTASPYVFTKEVRQASFGVVVTDSRNLGTAGMIVKTLIDYEPVKVNNYTFTRQAPTSSNVIFNGEFNYWGNSIGSYSNTATVKYKLDNGNWVTIPSANYTIDAVNHKLTITSYTISNILPYNQIGQFSISIEDALTYAEDTSDNGKVLKGVPTFDAGEHDLKVNGDLYIADTDGDNAVNVMTAINNAKFISNTYSTTEAIVGAWIDGKPIYRKVVNTGTLPNNTTKDVLHNISNLKRAIQVKGYAYRSSDNFTLPLPTASPTASASILTGVYGNYVRITTGTDRSGFTESYVAVDYTKTTDV